MSDFFIAYWCAFRNKYVEWIHIWGKELYRKNYHHWYHQNGGILFSMFLFPLLTLFPTFIRMLNSQVFSQKDEKFFFIIYNILSFVYENWKASYMHMPCIVRYGMYEFSKRKKLTPIVDKKSHETLNWKKNMIVSFIGFPFAIFSFVYAYCLSVHSGIYKFTYCYIYKQFILTFYSTRWCLLWTEYKNVSWTYMGRGS